jgi:Carboxypeptidase regulatory-like domain
MTGWEEPLARRRFSAVALLAVALLINQPLRGQTDTGTFRGLVTDASGAVVGGATITCRNLDTHVVRETRSDSLGGYEIGYLHPGPFELSVTKENFKPIVTSEIGLQVNQTARIDFHLEVGSVNEKVTITAEGSLLQSDSTVVGGQLDQKRLVELAGRDLIALIGLATSAADLSLTGFGSNSLTPLQPGRGTLGFNINLGGYRQTGNYYMLDGVSNSDWNINAIVTVPSVESLQELRVQTSTNSAAFGQVPGGTINLVTRSGSNNLHGQAYDYLRNAKLDARAYNFNPGVLPKPPFKSNQAGGSLGGPVVIPRLYNGRNHSFFFVHYEGLIRRAELQGTATVPTQAARTGQLAEYGRPIFDPLNLSNGLRVPFSGNAIPLDRLDTVAKKVIALTPTPSRGGTVNNLAVSRANIADNRQGSLRLDHELSPADFLAVSYHASSEVSNLDSALGSVTGTTTNVLSQNASVSHVHVFNANLLSNLKLGFNRMHAVDRVYGNQDYVSALGIQGLNHDTVNWGFPSFQTGSIQVVTDGPNRPTVQRDNLYQAIDDWTWTKGRHRLEMGGEFRRAQLNFSLANPARGQFRFTGAFTAGADPALPTQNTGLELADFLLGTPLQASRIIGVPQAYLRSSYAAGYFSDTFRVGRRLTLVLGVRYDYAPPPSEERNNYFNLDFSTLPNAPRLVRVGVDQSSLPERGVRANRADFSPRAGISWQAGSKTVIRSAYGVYHVQEIGAIYYELVRNGVRTEVNNSSALAPQLTTQSAFSNPVLSTPSYFYLNPGNTTPYVQQWNFGVQHELPLHSVFEIVYAGTKGTHLFRFRSMNTVFQTETGKNLDPRPGVLQQLRTFPSLGPITGLETSSSSTYHSLQMRFDKRFSAGVSWLQSFTWSKSIDDAGLPIQDFYQSTGAQDERNLRAEKGLSPLDVRKRFTSAVIWELPFGTGRKFVNHGILGYLAGPWQASSIFIAQDGYPQNLTNFGSLSTIGTLQRGNVVAGRQLVLSPADRANLRPTAQIPRPDLQYYNPAAITLPGTFELGNAGRDIGPTPGAARLDLSFLRTILLHGESNRLIIRADMVNALNMVNYGIPGAGPGSFTFGQLTTVGSMRTVTASLKLEF